MSFPRGWGPAASSPAEARGLLPVNGVKEGSGGAAVLPRRKDREVALRAVKARIVRRQHGKAVGRETFPGDRGDRADLTLRRRTRQERQLTSPMERQGHGRLKIPRTASSATGRAGPPKATFRVGKLSPKGRPALRLPLSSRPRRRRVSREKEELEAPRYVAV